MTNDEIKQHIKIIVDGVPAKVMVDPKQRAVIDSLAALVTSFLISINDIDMYSVRG